MCGIVGFIGAGGSDEQQLVAVERMAAAIHHRGPDGGGAVVGSNVALAMKRLAIVDVRDGHQPMANDDASIVIVYNGEVYNAPALRRELEQRGTRFRTRSDTEVILRLYETDPDAVEERLAGMWAFAIHDRRRRRVVLSRDRFGIKPLFVADTGRALAFASELVSFDRAHPAITSAFEVDHAAAHAMLSWSYIPEDATIWKGVRRLPPATRLTIDLESGIRRTKRFWHVTPSAAAGGVRSLDEACELVSGALGRSVKEHLESDVPIATFLSGGIDSSLVTAFARDASPAPLRAFGVGFRDPRFDESPFARETAARLGVDIEIVTLDEKAARDAVADALASYDEPFGDSSSIATYLLCAHVAKTHKVVLGGDGGDEGYAGYKKYLVMRLREPLARAPFVRDGIGRALGALPTRTDRTRKWTEALRTLRRVSRGLHGEAVDVQVALAQVAPLARTEALVARPADASRFLEAARVRYTESDGSELQRMLACELGNALANDMLVKVDRASMAHHLEARVPFLDHRVVEIGLGLPVRFSLGRNGKRVLRAMHERRFGAELAHRKKQGFGVPVESWLRDWLDPACETLFETARLERYGILSSAALGGGRFRDWVRTDPQVVWHAFSLAAWCEVHLGGGRDALREILTRGPRRV